MSNTVTLTIAGDPKPAVDAFKQVGAASDDMAKQVKHSGDAFDDAAEKSDTLDTRAMGFRDTLTGVQDSVSGIKKAAAGDWGFETLLMLGFGVGDLASGFTNFLIPAVKNMKIAQWALNFAWLTSPITWIVLGIVILTAAIILIATKTDWFSRAWRASWKWIKDAAADTWDFLKRIPGWLGTAFSQVANFITWPFRMAFNFIADAWNHTIGSLSWSVPGWIPAIGGKTISVPNIPKFHSGGTVPGPAGSEMLAILQAGETVTPAGGGGTVIEIRSGGTELDDALVQILTRAIRRLGGNVQLVLGGPNA